MKIIDFVVRVMVLCIIITFPVSAQHNHAAGHDVYSQWRNQQDFLCCNGNDCGVIDETAERMVDGKTQVFVGYGSEQKEWCPVIESIHSLKGKVRSPDYSASHACVLPPSWGGTVCERLKCYMPRPFT